MKKLLNDLQNYIPEDSQEQKTKDAFLELIQKPNCFDKNYDHGGHFTASAFIINKTRDKTLLVHHAKLNKWVQPGGHCDGSSDAFASACREVKEETGLIHITPLNEGLFHLDLHTIPAYPKKNEPEHKHYDLRYAFIAHDQDPLILSDESHDVKWFNFDDVTNIETDNSIHHMIKKIQKLS